MMDERNQSQKAITPLVVHYIKENRKKKNSGFQGCGQGHELTTRA